MVSVIVPVYQVSDYVERCISSVMAQSYTDIECIIVDDATKDDSIVKCERLIEEYNDNLNLDDNQNGIIKFKILHHEVNRGLSAARNTGTRAASGEYLFYLDSDDYITPNCIERLAAVVQEDSSIEMVQGNSLIKSDGKDNPLGKVKQPVRISNNDEARKEFYKNRNVYISVWNRLLKKSFIEEYGLYCREGIVCEDLLWIFYLMKHLNRAYLCDEVTYHYILRSGSILTNEKPESMKSYTVIFDEIFHNLTVEREQEEIKGFLYYFIRRYVSYVKIVPEFKDTIRIYISRAWQYHCWKVYIVLFFIRVFGDLGNPSWLMVRMNRIRWRIKNFVKTIKNAIVR